MNSSRREFSAAASPSRRGEPSVASLGSQRGNPCAVPGPPSNVSFPDVTTTTARIIWDVPREPNGEILGYRIAFWLHHSGGGGSSEGEARVSREVPATDRTLKAFDLEVGPHRRAFWRGSLPCGDCSK